MAKGGEKQQVQPQQQTCPQCGFSYKQFLKEGKFGCPSCYDTFGDHLPKLLIVFRQVHNTLEKCLVLAVMCMLLKANRRYPQAYEIRRR